MSIARLLAGQVGDGTVFHTPDGEAGRVSGVFKVMGQHFDKRGPATAGETVAFGKLDHAKTGDTLTRRQAGACGARRGEALSAGAGARGAGQGAQGRRQARRRLHQAHRRGPLAHRRAQRREPRGGDLGPGRDASARRRRAAGDRYAVPVSRGRRRSATRRPSASRSRCAGGTRSSPAATASSATRCWRSSRCRAAPASSSRTASPAAWCRATTSRRWKRA